jgi:hypothetical protein
MEARNLMEMVSAHLTVQEVTFFKKDSIRPDGSNKSNGDGSPHLSVQKVTFFKERERRGSTRRGFIQPDVSKKSDEDGQRSS